MSWERCDMDGSRVRGNILRSMSLNREVVVVSVSVCLAQSISVSKTVSAIQTQRVNRLQRAGDVGLDDSWGMPESISSIQTQRVDGLQSVHIGLNDGWSVLRSVVSEKAVVVGGVRKSGRVRV
ncbi:melanoma-associated antigen B1-like protein [Anopheles sinensis]|uniref:Melanoma-associated antigen B1-like protein n=1 Tax=Anopheles sinensis TaxID=74873 RepID=A0A084W1W4_ANOSI|nr:melanoma-associated antigen B1-like protein [Anopheles sinensis]